ncbi:hypothetical protein ACFE04_002853 [Oxalis oulophora]
MVEEESNESILELNVPFGENIGLDEISTHVNQSTNVNQKIPFVAMMFDSEDELYAYYKKYSFEVGFGVRKFGCKNGKREGVKYYSLACAKGGKYVPKLDYVKTRLSIKTECEAKLIDESYLSDDMEQASPRRIVEDHPKEKSKRKLLSPLKVRGKGRPSTKRNMSKIEKIMQNKNKNKNKPHKGKKIATSKTS